MFVKVLPATAGIIETNSAKPLKSEIDIERNVVHEQARTQYHY